jgi:hypothetical protein
MRPLDNERCFRKSLHFPQDKLCALPSGVRNFGHRLGLGWFQVMPRLIRPKGSATATRSAKPHSGVSFLLKAARMVGMAVDGDRRAGGCRRPQTIKPSEQKLPSEVTLGSLQASIYAKPWDGCYFAGKASDGDMVRWCEF